jgi:transmembrane sensor
MAEKAEALDQAAAAWFARLQRDDVSSSDREAFERWLDEPAHAVAYARVEAAWERADRLKAAGTVVAEAPSPAPVWTRRAAAAVLAVGVGGAIAYAVRPDNGASFETGVGERKTVKLEDGSAVELNTATRLRTAFTPERRDVHLLAGEALFHVAKDPKRPFVVHARDARVRALGTAFNVRIREKLVELTVTEGVVTVNEAPSILRVGARSIRPLSAGEGAVMGPGAVARVALQEADLQRRIAWRNGLIELRGETLEQAVAEFNRYRTRKLVVADPSLAGLRVGGSFETGDSERFLAALKDGFHIQTVEGDDGVTYLVPTA